MKISPIEEAKRLAFLLAYKKLCEEHGYRLEGMGMCPRILPMDSDAQQEWVIDLTHPDADDWDSDAARVTISGLDWHIDRIKENSRMGFRYEW